MAHDDTSLEELLRRRGAAAPGRAGMAVPTGLCGDPELLAAYAEGTLPPAARARLEGHLAACTACQTAVVRLVRLAPQESAARPSAEQAPALSRTAVFRWRWAVPALAGVALVGSFIYHERGSIFRTARQPLEQSVKTAPATSAPKAEPLPPAGQGFEQSRPARRYGSVEILGSAEQKKLLEPQKPIGAGGGGGIGGGIPRLPPSRSGDLQVATEAREIRAREKDKAVQQAPAGAPAGEVAQQRSSSAANVVVAPPVPPPAPQQFAQQSAPDKPQAAAGAGVGSGRGGGIGTGTAAGVAQKEAPAAQDEARAKAMVRPLRSQAEEQGKPAEAETSARPAAPPAGIRAEAVGGAPGARTAAAPKTASSAESVVVTPGPTSTVNLDARRADASRFSKQLQSEKRRFALADGGQLLTSQTTSSQWETVAIPSRSPVIDFSIVGRHLWVLLPGGRVGHSPDLGRTWDAPWESGAADAISIAFKNPQSGEIRTRSGRRLQSVDGGETWKPIQKD